MFSGDETWDSDLQNLPKKYKKSVNEITSYIDEQSALRGLEYLRPSVGQQNVPSRQQNVPSRTHNAFEAFGIQRTNQEQRIRNAFKNF